MGMYKLRCIKSGVELWEFHSFRGTKQGALKKRFLTNGKEFSFDLMLNLEFKKYFLAYVQIEVLHHEIPYQVPYEGAPEARSVP